MHKTGTTSVQANLVKTAAPDNWRILTVGGRPNMGMALFAMFATDPHQFHLFAKKGLTAEFVARRGETLRRRLKRAVAKATEETLVISGEAACLMDPAGIARMRDFLVPLCDEVRVIGYVRPPAGFKTSIFQQHLKYGPCQLDFSRIRVSYRRKFEKFDEAFGRENVILRKFDPVTFPDGCMVADFCQTIGIRPPPPASIFRVNEGMTREACGILYAYRQLGPGVPRGKDFIRENNRLVAPLLALSGTKFRVSPELLEAGSPDSLRWIERRLGTRLDEKPGSGPAVRDEADLLAIGRDACLEYLRKFQEIHGIKVRPPRKIPAGGPVPPELVAELVETCRLALQTGATDAKSGGIARLVKKILNYRSGPAHPGRRR